MYTKIKKNILIPKMTLSFGKLNPKNIKKIKKATIDNQMVDTSDFEVNLPAPSPGAQEMFYNTPADVCIYGGAAGSGKAESCYGLGWAFQHILGFTADYYHDIIHLVPKEIRDMDSKVLMWNGEWKEFSEVAVGDRIMNPDGHPQEIIQVHERGLLDVYKVTFEDKTSIECSGDHLWGFWEARQDSRKKTREGKKLILDNNDATNWNINYISRARVRDTEWLFQEIQKDRRFIIPITAPLNYTHISRGREDRAYLYGVLLGDGMIQGRKTNGIGFCTADIWIQERCLSLLEKYSIRDKSEQSQQPYFADITIKDDWVRNWAVNTGLMGKYSHEKFIPKGYLKESLGFRWNLAQGLFDTDGYAATATVEKNEVSYCTVSPELAEDVANLVRSLGFIAKIRQKQGVCYTKGYEGEKRMAYIVSVEGNNRHRLFSLPRKIEAAMSHEPNIWVGKAITNIEKLGRQAYCRCITVSNPNHLYITDGYNVTHNSFSMLLKASKFLKVPGYGSVILRRTRPEITNEGGLWDESRNLYKLIPKAQAREYQLDWVFPTGSAISFGHAQYEKDVEDKYPGSQICHLGFDELTKFTERQFWFLFSRNRSTCGVRPRIDATCNPDADSWVAKLVAWYIDQDTGYPIEERSGVLRYFYRINGEIHWGDTEQELMDQFPDLAAIAPPKSFTFIKGTVYDNPHLLESNPQYLQNLLSLHPVEMERLLKGNWKIKYEAGTIFNRHWFEVVNSVPAGGQTVAFWDFAATSSATASKSSFYSVRTKIKLYQGIYYVLDCFWEQVSADDGDNSVLKIAQQDGTACKVRWELEGGSAGKRYESSLKRQLVGFDARGVKPLGDKVTRAMPLAVAAKDGKVKLFRGAWNDQFLAALHEFDGSKKPLTNDIVDSADGAFGELQESTPRSSFVGGRIHNPFS